MEKTATEIARELVREAVRLDSMALAYRIAAKELTGATTRDTQELDRQLLEGESS